MRARRRTDYAEDPETGPLNHPLGELGPLFAPVPCRAGSDTSAEAADRIALVVAHHRRIVAEAFAAAGLRGLTGWECSDVTGLDILNCRPRITDLFTAGVLEDTGLRRPNPKGNNERVLRSRT